MQMSDDDLIAAALDVRGRHADWPAETIVAAAAALSSLAPRDDVAETLERVAAVFASELRRRRESVAPRTRG